MQKCVVAGQNESLNGPLSAHLTYSVLFVSVYAVAAICVFLLLSFPPLLPLHPQAVTARQAATIKTIILFNTAASFYVFILKIISLKTVFKVSKTF